MKSVYVRLRPYDPRRGNVVRRYCIGGQLFITDQDTKRPIWYQVPVAFARQLQELRQTEAYNSPPLFDIVDEEGYQEIFRHEEQLRLVEMGLMASQAIKPQVQPKAIDLRATGRGAAVPEPTSSPVAEAPSPAVSPQAAVAPVVPVAAPRSIVEPPAPIAMPVMQVPPPVTVPLAEPVVSMPDLSDDDDDTSDGDDDDDPNNPDFDDDEPVVVPVVQTAPVPAKPGRRRRRS